MADDDDPILVNPVLLKQAEQLCKDKLKKAPESRGILRSLAEVYRKLGNPSEAAAVYMQLCELDPQDQNAAYMRAVFGAKEWAPAPAGMRAAPFVLIRDFMPHEFHNALLPLFTSVQDKFIPAVLEDGRTGELSYLPDRRQTLEYREEWEGRMEFSRRLVKEIPSVMRAVYLPDCQIRRFEITVFAYQDGHFLKVHTDAGAGADTRNAKRKVNFVYFFHKLPRPYSGGELLVFDSDPQANDYTRARFTTIVPEANSIVFFPADFYHSVVPIRCPSKAFADSRFAIVGQLNTRPEVSSPVVGQKGLTGATAADVS